MTITISNFLVDNYQVPLFSLMISITTYHHFHHASLAIITHTYLSWRETTNFIVFFVVFNRPFPWRGLNDFHDRYFFWKTTWWVILARNFDPHYPVLCSPNKQKFILTNILFNKSILKLLLNFFAFQVMILLSLFVLLI